MQTLSPQQFQQLIAQDDVCLLDVRMPEEVEVACLDGALHIPLHELPQRFGEVNPQQAVGIYCHHGVRSEHAARFLEHQGYTRVSHLAGGIDAWSVAIDSTLARY